MDRLVAQLDHQRYGDIHAAEGRLFSRYGLEALLPVLVAAYPRLRHAQARNSVLFWLTRFARRYPEVVDLAVTALRDPAYMPRMQACAILAYSLRRDAIPHLTLLRKHRDRKTRDDAEAAIDAIQHQNHHYWFDRDHSGCFFWTVNPDDERPPNHPLRQQGGT